MVPRFLENLCTSDINRKNKINRHEETKLLTAGNIRGTLRSN